MQLGFWEFYSMSLIFNESLGRSFAIFKICNEIPSYSRWFCFFFFGSGHYEMSNQQKKKNIGNYASLFHSCCYLEPISSFTIFKYFILKYFIYYLHFPDQFIWDAINFIIDQRLSKGKKLLSQNQHNLQTV